MSTSVPSKHYSSFAARSRMGRRFNHDRHSGAVFCQNHRLDRHRICSLPTELVRLIATMSLVQEHCVIGGTVVIVAFLTLSTGALIAVQGYTQFSNIGWSLTGSHRPTSTCD